MVKKIKIREIKPRIKIIEKGEQKEKIQDNSSIDEDGGFGDFSPRARARFSPTDLFSKATAEASQVAPIEEIATPPPVSSDPAPLDPLPSSERGYTAGGDARAENQREEDRVRRYSSNRPTNQLSQPEELQTRDDLISPRPQGFDRRNQEPSMTNSEDLKRYDDGQTHQHISAPKQKRNHF